MATMEKITYPPIIEHLKAEEQFYTQLISEYEIKQGAFPAALFKKILIEYLEPMVSELCEDDKPILSHITKAFILELLPVLKNNTLIHHLELYKKAWALVYTIPDIFKQDPRKVLIALHSSLSSFEQIAPLKAFQWLNLMTEVSSLSASFSEFIHLGRVTAWQAGMAHLREKAEESYTILHEELKAALETQFEGPQSLREALQTPWVLKADSSSLLQFGGFAGFKNGVFSRPPKVILHEDTLLASDGENTCALFADSCGTVLIPTINIRIDTIPELHPNAQLLNKRIKQALFKDISSFIQLNESMIFTRKSSFYIYLQHI
jgi:hypothetical protein